MVDKHLIFCYLYKHYAFKIIFLVIAVEAITKMNERSQKKEHTIRKKTVRDNYRNSN